MDLNFPPKLFLQTTHKSLIEGQSTMPTYHWVNFSSLKDAQKVSVQLKGFGIRPNLYLQTGA